jgi:hypothetical protein
MHGVNGRQHWHGVHKGSLRNHGDGIYRDWIKSFDSLLEPLEKRGVSVINCTPNSSLRCFPFEEVPA